MSKLFTVSTLLETANGLDESTRVAYLRNITQNNKLYEKAIKYVVQAALHPNVVWLLPQGYIYYMATKENADIEYRFYKEADKFNIFLRGGGYDNLDPKRRRDIFTQVLESIDPRDADLLMQIKDKKLPYPNLTYDFFRKYFPEYELPAKSNQVIETQADVSEIVPEKLPFDMVAEIKEGVGKAHNKGKAWFNNGTDSFLISLEEGYSKGLQTGRIKKEKKNGN